MADCKDSNYMAIFRGVCVIITGAVIIWMCSTVRTNETSIAVHKEQIVNIHKVQSEIKDTNKEMLKLLNAIRYDQLKRTGIVQ